MPWRSPERVRHVAPLGDDAVERGADAAQPFLRVGELGGRRRQPDATALREIFLARTLPAACGAPAAARRPARRPPSASRSNTISSAGVSCDSFLIAARRRMDALQQRVERKHLAVAARRSRRRARSARRFERPHRLDHVGEIARQRLAGLRLQLDRRRRGTPGSGSRPTSARTATPARPAPRRPTGPPSAANGGRSASSHGPTTQMAGFWPAIAKKI